jgi:hypothetical protein
MSPRPSMINKHFSCSLSAPYYELSPRENTWDAWSGDPFLKKKLLRRFLYICKSTKYTYWIFLDSGVFLPKRWLFTLLCAKVLYESTM